MAPTHPLMTVDEYFTETPLTVKPAELVFGVLRAAESPTPRHQSMVADLFRALDAHVRANGSGQVWIAPLDVVLSVREALIVQPDLFFVSKERDWIVTDRVRGAPDLVVEVLSPNPRIGQIDERVGWFARHGVRECWLVHQDQRTVSVLQFADDREQARRTFAGHERIVSGVLPEFTASLEDIMK